MDAADDRLLALDVLRGVAVMGILLLNIIGFAMPEAAYLNPGAWGGKSVADVATWAIMFVLFDGKMRALFSMLFGASMLLVIDRAEMAGRDGRATQISRSFWLFLFGLAHYLLLWWGDILMIYAIVGLVALRFVGHEPLGLVKWAFIAFLAHFLIVGGMTAGMEVLRHMATGPDASASDIDAWQALQISLGKPGSVEITQSVALHRSGFTSIFADSLANLPTQLVSLFYFFFDTLGFMLLGMAMLKGDFLTGGWDRSQYSRTARHCFLIGLPPLIAMAVWVILSGYDALTAFGVFMAWSFPFRVPLAVGWAALILLMLQCAPSRNITLRLASSGKMALSNYLLTSLVMTTLFYGWGFGLFGKIDRAPIYGVVLAMWVIMLLWSKPWLDRFAYGPIEWLWRSLSQRRVLPMRRFAPN